MLVPYEHNSVVALNTTKERFSVANVTKKTITRTIEVEETGVVLELTEDEALVIRALVCNVGGSPGGLRQHAQSVYSALVKAGYDYYGNQKVRETLRNLEGTISFD